MSDLIPVGEYAISSKDVIQYRPRDRVYIYGLICPITNLVFYVGKTTNPQARLIDHAKNQPRLAELIPHEQEYTFRLVTYAVYEFDEYEREIESLWILRFLEDGIELVNKVFPSKLSPELVGRLDRMCDKYGWTCRKSRNGLVVDLPEYKRV